MKGYKIFGPEYTCKDYKYDTENINTCEGPLKMCKRGFHFCIDPVDCLKYYDFKPWNTFAEVEAIGPVEVKDDKVACLQLRIVKKLKFYKFGKLLNYSVDTPELKCTYVKGFLHGSYNEYKKTVYQSHTECLHTESNYKKGNLHGEYTEYTNDKITKKCTYNNGRLHGLFTEYYKNGNKFKQVEYINGDKTGDFKIWHQNGNIYTECTYVIGKIQGKYKTFSEDGIIILECNYNNDELDGEYKIWNDRGEIQKDYNYKNGVLHGSYKEYFCGLDKDCTYVDGKLNGNYKQYYMNGDIKFDFNYLNGVEHGICKTYDPYYHQLSDEDEYINGKLIYYKAWRNGKITSQGYV